MKTGKKSHAFLYFILIWTVLLLAAGTVGLYKLSDFLWVYESCELAPVKAEFEESFGEDNLDADALDAYISTLDCTVRTAEEYSEIIRSQLRGELLLEKITAESNTHKAVYRISVDGTAVGRVTFEKNVPMAYGLYAWQCTGESYSFGYLLETDTIEVPDSYTVSVNGRVLDGSYIVSEREIEGYENVSRYAEPDRRLYTYSIESMGEQSIEILDEYGRSVSPGELGSDRFIDNCTDAQKEAISALGSNFIELYTNYSTGLNYYGYYYQLQNICVSGSDIMTRLTNSLDGYQYSMRRSAEISSMEIYRVSQVNSTQFICDIRYTVDANAYTEIITTDYDVRLVVEYVDGSYLVSVLTSN